MDKMPVDRVQYLRRFSLSSLNIIHLLTNALASKSESQHKTSMQHQTPLQLLLPHFEVKSTGFIITIYGDVVVPRGGSLWTGSLIEICHEIGLSETVVRTSLSRLVASQRLEGVKQGRRSFYQLHPSAVAEFRTASNLVYHEPLPSQGWQIIHSPSSSDDELKALQAVRLAPQVLIRPNRGAAVPKDMLCFQAQDPCDMRALAKLWDLTELRANYQTMLVHFTPIHEAIASGMSYAPLQAFMLRLLLVHVFRSAVLRDPLLPPFVLDQNWPGFAARSLFMQLYAALSPAASLHISHHLQGPNGHLDA